MKKFILSLAVMGSLMATTAQAAIVVHTSDFIATTDRTGFNGFESIPNDGTMYTGGAGPYSEGGISVAQVGGDGGNDIWIDYLPAGTEGGRAWYPNGGDYGYTKITRTNGVDFDRVGFGVASGGPATRNVLYELYSNGSRVLSGSSLMAGHYLGFSGGGFDAIYLVDNCCGATSVTGRALQGLVVDSIEIAAAEVPEPASLAIFGIAALGLTISRRRKQTT